MWASKRFSRQNVLLYTPDHLSLICETHRRVMKRASSMWSMCTPRHVCLNSSNTHTCINNKILKRTTKLEKRGADC